MRVIIEPDYKTLSRWAACYVASRINAAKPTEENSCESFTGVNHLGRFDEKVYSAFSLLFSLIIYTNNFPGLAAINKTKIRMI